MRKFRDFDENSKVAIKKLAGMGFLVLLIGIALLMINSSNLFLSFLDIVVFIVCGGTFAGSWTIYDLNRNNLVLNERKNVYIYLHNRLGLSLNECEQVIAGEYTIPLTKRYKPELNGLRYNHHKRNVIADFLNNKKR